MAVEGVDLAVEVMAMEDVGSVWGLKQNPRKKGGGKKHNGGVVKRMDPGGLENSGW